MFLFLTRFLRSHSHVNWALADQVVVSGANFVTTILLARFLGLTEFGIFSIAWLVVLFINGIQLALIVSPMMSIGPQKEDKLAPSYYGSMIGLQILLSTGAFIFVFTCMSFGESLLLAWPLKKLALPVATATLFFLAQEFLRRYFFTRDRGVLAFTNDLISYGGQLVVFGIIIRMQTIRIDSGGALWVIAMTSGLAVLVGSLQIGLVEWRRERLLPYFAETWALGKWLIASVILQWSTGNLLTILSGVTLGAASAGVIKATQNILGVTHVLFQAFENLVPVRGAMRLRDGGKQALDAYLRKIMIFGLLTTTFIAVLVGTIPSFWLQLFYGDTLDNYVSVLSWFASMYPFAFLVLFFRLKLRIIGNSRPIFITYGLMTITILGVVYPLAKNYGVDGVVIAMLLGNIAGAIAIFWSTEIAQRQLYGQVP